MVFCQLAVLFSLLVPTAFHNRAFAVVHRRQNERNTVCDGGATRFSYFVFQFQFDRTKYENRLLISFTDFRIPTGDTKNGLIYRYFVFCTTYGIRNTKYGSLYRFSYSVRRTKNKITVYTRTANHGSFLTVHSVGPNITCLCVLYLVYALKC